MKRFALEFLRRGLTACGLGPLVLAVFYLVMQHQGALKVLSVDQVCLGILSLSALAFIAGGMNVIYQLERLPLMVAILIHDSVLYIGYLVTYLVNDWLEWSTVPILVFTGIFFIGYLVIWWIIYSVIKRNADRLNECMKQNRQKHDLPSP